MTRRYALRDDQWERIKELLPGKEGDVGVTAKDNRLLVEAVLYRYRAGIPWRDWPEDRPRLPVLERTLLPFLPCYPDRGERESEPVWPLNLND